ncbi:hypothetical protein S245_024714 [Arachis hypogaea]
MFKEEKRSHSSLLSSLKTIKATTSNRAAHGSTAATSAPSRVEVQRRRRSLTLSPLFERALCVYRASVTVSSVRASLAAVSSISHCHCEFTLSLSFIPRHLSPSF